MKGGGGKNMKKLREQNQKKNKKKKGISNPAQAHFLSPPWMTVTTSPKFTSANRHKRKRPQSKPPSLLIRSQNLTDGGKLRSGAQVTESTNHDGDWN